VVERRYRENLNTKILALQNLLASTRQSQCSSGSGSDVDAKESTACRRRKAEVLVDAMNYIKRAEDEKKGLQNEVEFLKLRIVSLEKLVNCEDSVVRKEIGNYSVE
jgi:hypothetical protein